MDSGYRKDSMSQRLAHPTRGLQLLPNGPGIKKIGGSVTLAGGTHYEFCTNFNRKLSVIRIDNLEYLIPIENIASVDHMLSYRPNDRSVTP